MGPSCETGQNQLLVLRCQAGDRDAFALLFRQYYKPVLYFLAKSMGDLEVARDLSQETWLKAYRKRHTLREPKKFRCWLYAIARREALMALRRRSLQAEEQLPDEVWNGDVVETTAYRPEEAERLNEALDLLSHRHREVLVLRFLHDMSYAEIAAVVDCSAGTVRSRLHYAGKALRKLLESGLDAEQGVGSACNAVADADGEKSHASD